MMSWDLHVDDALSCGYHCRSSDALPDEQIIWNELYVDTPKFMVESDATIVAPLVFAYLLGD